MPKIISNFHNSTSQQVNKDGLENSNQTQLPVYFCICGVFCITLDRPLTELPKRKTDESFILQKEKVIYRLNLVPGPTVYLKRDEGIEKQYRLLCQGCNLWIAYRSLPEDEGPTYILKDALRDTPNVLPERFKTLVENGELIN